MQRRLDKLAAYRDRTHIELAALLALPEQEQRAKRRMIQHRISLIEHLETYMAKVARSIGCADILLRS